MPDDEYAATFKTYLAGVQSRADPDGTKLRHEIIAKHLE